MGQPTARGTAYRAESEGPAMKQEIERRASLKDRVRAYLEARPCEWISMVDLSQVGGLGGFRTRISELRVKDGLNIVHNGRNGLNSQYMFLPYEPLGPDAARVRSQKSLFPL
jgi:hypothetical protein